MLIIRLCDQSLRTTLLGQWFSTGTLCPHPVTPGHVWQHFWMLTLGKGYWHLVGVGRRETPYNAQDSPAPPQANHRAEAGEQ